MSFFIGVSLVHTVYRYLAYQGNESIFDDSYLVEIEP